MATLHRTITLTFCGRSSLCEGKVRRRAIGSFGSALEEPRWKLPHG